jgi:hypothetical protein
MNNGDFGVDGVTVCSLASILDTIVKPEVEGFAADGDKRGELERAAIGFNLPYLPIF